MANLQRPFTADQPKRQPPDFKEFLNEYAHAASKKIYGIKTAPRDREPSMNLLLSWNQSENDIWNFKKNKQGIEDLNELEKINKRINKTSTPWVSENQDNFRKFIYNEGQKQPIFYEIYDSEIRDIPGMIPSPSRCKHLRRNPGEADGKNLSTYQHDYVTNQRPVEDRLTLETAKTLKKNPVKKGKGQKKGNEGRKNSATLKEEAKRELVEKLKRESRQLPNTSFVTYFGKPAFANYGNGNLKPSVGGHLYGEYMKSHNVGPHSGSNHPQYRQSYKTALHKSQKAVAKEPQLPIKIIQKESTCSHNSKGNLEYMPDENSYESKRLMRPNLEKSIKIAQKVDNNQLATLNKKEKSKKSPKRKSTEKVDENSETVNLREYNATKNKKDEHARGPQDTASFGNGTMNKNNAPKEENDENSKNDTGNTNNARYENPNNERDEKVEISLNEYQEYLKLKHSKANQKQIQRSVTTYSHPAGVKVIKDDSVKGIFDQWETLLKNQWQDEEEL